MTPQWVIRDGSATASSTNTQKPSLNKCHHPSNWPKIIWTQTPVLPLVSKLFYPLNPIPSCTEWRACAWESKLQSTGPVAPSLIYKAELMLLHKRLPRLQSRSTISDLRSDAKQDVSHTPQANTSHEYGDKTLSKMLAKHILQRMTRKHTSRPSGIYLW